jgi:hypothetical protein
MSRSTQAVVMMVCWWVVVVTPTALLLAGLFRVDGRAGVGDVEASGGIVLLWVISFIVQVLILLLLAKPVGHVTLWSLFMGSLFPWVVNYGAPYSLGVAIALIALAAGIAALVAFLSVRTIRLDERGRRVTATVVREIPTAMRTVVNNIYVRRKVELDIPAEDGTTYRGTLAMLYEMGTWPTPGDQVPLRVDPENPKRYSVASNASESATR